jgi:hypothetical protein
VEWQQIERDRKVAGITEITLRRARESLGVKIRREGEPGRRGGGRSVWELPEVLGAQKDLLVQDAHTEKSEQVNNSSFKSDPLPKTVEQVNPLNDDTPDYPIQPCRCGCLDYWLREASQWGPAEWLCAKCHPQPKGGDGR